MCVHTDNTNQQPDLPPRAAAVPDDFHKLVFEAIPNPIFVVDRDARILDCNAAAAQMTGEALGLGRRAGEVLLCIHAQATPEGCGRSPACAECAVRNAVTQAFAGTPQRRVRHKVATRPGTPEAHLLVSTTPIQYRGRALVLLVLEDVTELLALRRILPICAHCRQVRDDARYWQDVESYCRRELAIDFSHGICPACLARYYPEWASKATQS
jgi:PAS domain-containing protein